MAEFNPFAAPEAEIVRGAPTENLDAGRGVWADGKAVVMVKLGTLPARCIRCDAPTTARIVRTFVWHPMGYYLFLLVGLFPYLVAYLIVRKKAKVAVPICAAHRAARRRMFLINWIVGLGGLALCFTPAYDPNLAWMVAIGLLMIFGSLVFAAVKSPLMVPLRIDATHAWFKKVSPAFLASLPPLPEEVVEI